MFNQLKIIVIMAALLAVGACGSDGVKFEKMEKQQLNIHINDFMLCFELS